MLKQAHPERIIVPEDRVRKEFNKTKLQRLAESCHRLGQCQPGVCTLHPEKENHFILVAGERRLRACKIADIPFTFVLREDADPEVLLEIEIEENLNRENLSWQEEVFAIDRLHLLREKQQAKLGGKQRTKDTASEAEKSVGATHEDLILAQWAKSIPEVASAKSKTEAKKIIKRFEGNIVREKMFTEAKETATESEARIEAAPEKQTQDRTVDFMGRKITNDWILDIDRRVIEGKMEDKLNDFRDNSIDLVIFDPPWGVGREEESMAQEKTPDEPERYLGNIQRWLDNLYSKMAEDSHLYLFFGIIYHEVTYQVLEAVGYKVNRIPLIWYKQGTHHQHNPKKWHGLSYEPIAFARKGNKDLQTYGAPDVIITPGSTRSMKQTHPHAKHPDIYMELIKRSAFPGDTILDPMAGSGMFGVAAETYRTTKKLDWWMIEEKTNFRTLAVSNIVKGYSDVVNREPIQVVDTTYSDNHPIPQDFKELDPGTDLWKRYWDTNKDKQEEMLEWRKSSGR